MRVIGERLERTSPSPSSNTLLCNSVVHLPISRRYHVAFAIGPNEVTTTGALGGCGAGPERSATQDARAERASANSLESVRVGFNLTEPATPCDRTAGFVLADVPMLGGSVPIPGWRRGPSTIPV